MPVKLKMTSCASAAEVIAAHGVDKDMFMDFRDYEVDADELAAFRADKSGALIGDRVARKYGWKAGDSIVLEELGGVSFTVRGIFSREGASDDYLILLDRTYLQEVADEQGISNFVLVKLVPDADVEDAVAAIDALPLSVQTETKTEDAFLAAALAQIADLVTVARWVIVIIVLIILVAMGNAISMATRERAGEFAILRTLGFGRTAVLSMVLAEGLLLAAVGGLIGAGAVEAISRAGLVSSISTLGVTISFTTSLQALGAGVLLTCLTGGVGSFIPGVNAARLDIVTALNRED